VTTPYIGEIRMFGGNFAPYGWFLCNGQLLPISAYEALFALIGTTYGGDGVSNFALPNLQSRVGVHTGTGLPIGTAAGTETVALTTAQLPTHSHGFQASGSAGTQRSPVNNTPAATPATVNIYAEYPADVQLAPQTIMSDGGGGQPHNNIQPYQCITFIIAWTGVFPTQN
jgi:microcystin-dependent protein